MLTRRRRLATRAKALGRKALSDLGCILTPDTPLCWYRQLIAKKYDGSARRRPGRPRTRHEIQELVVKLARENPTWGYTRIRDTMSGLGHAIGRTTVQTILKDHGLEPAPERQRKTTWKAFLKAHWGAIAACDFFTVEVATVFG